MLTGTREFMRLPRRFGRVRISLGRSCVKGMLNDSPVRLEATLKRSAPKETRSSRTKAMLRARGERVNATNRQERDCTGGQRRTVRQMFVRRNSREAN